MFVRLCKAIAVVVAAFAPLSFAWAQDRAAIGDVALPQPPVWKTITLGRYTGTFALFAALDAADIHVGEAAEEILHRPAFTLTRDRSDVQLVRLSAAQLGFGPHGATIAEITERAQQLGFELCPAEVAPLLRLHYADQPVGQFLHVAMRPIATYAGQVVSFSLGNGGAGLLLVGFEGRDQVMPAEVAFVFVRPLRVALPAQPR